MRRASLLVLFLTVFIDLIGFGMVIPFLSYYAREYGASGLAVGSVVGIYSIMQFFFAPVWGRLSDRVGRRPVLLVSLMASTTGYLLFAFSHSLTVLFVSRVIAGIGGANIGTAQAYITDVTTPENRAKGMGLIGAAFGLGFVLGPPMSGILASIGARHGMAGNLLPGLVAGGLSFTAFLIALSVLAESKPANLVPRSGLPPQFDRRLWREIAGNGLLAALMGGLFLTLLAISGMEISVTLHGRDRFGFRQMQMAYLFLFMGAIVVAIQGGLIGRLVTKLGEKRVIVLGGMSFVLGFVLVPSIWRVPLLYAVAFFIAIGQGLCYPALMSLVSKASPENERGSILGLATSAGSLARFIGPLLTSLLYDFAGAAGAFYGGAVFMLAALWIAVRMRAPAQLVSPDSGKLPPMSILKVSRLGHPVLREKASDVALEDIKAGKFRTLIEDMVETMHAYEGVGLAGPQVHLSLRVFVFEVQERVAKRRGVKQLGAGAIFNATYEPVGTDTITDWEGCLSVPFLGGDTPRYKRVRLRGFDHDGDPLELEVEDFTARIFQHEIDHTDGRVYLDRMPDLRSLGYTIVL